jgi:hypothetical protein
MSLDVNNLGIQPLTLKKGDKQCLVSFKGILTTVAGNPVKLNLFIDPMEPVFVIDAAQNELKRLTFSEDMDGGLKDYSVNIVLRVKEKPAQPTRVSIRLEGEDAKGFRSSTNSFVVYS